MKNIECNDRVVVIELKVNCKFIVRFGVGPLQMLELAWFSGKISLCVRKFGFYFLCFRCRYLCLRTFIKTQALNLEI